MNLQSFANYVRAECEENNINFELRDVGYLRADGLVAMGYFDNISLVVATKGSSSESITKTLVHEFSHFIQWKNKHEASERFDKEFSGTHVGLWLQGYDIKNIEHHLRTIVAMELDCEKTAVDYIKKLKLPVSVEQYKKQANAYLFYYGWVYETRKWCKPHKSPSENKKLLKVVPTRFRTDYLKIPDKIYKVFEQEYGR